VWFTIVQVYQQRKVVPTREVSVIRTSFPSQNIIIIGNMIAVASSNKQFRAGFMKPTFLLHRLPALRIYCLGYGLDDRGSVVRFPAWAGNFSLHRRIQNGSGDHTTSYPMGIRGSFLRGKAAGT